MVATAITIQDLAGPFDIPAADGADFTWTAADNANGNSVQCTGRELILLRNDNVGAQTVTFDSVEDEKQRSGDITAYSIGIGEYAHFSTALTNQKGWKQTDGKVTFTASAADVYIAVLRLPDGVGR